MWEISHLEPWKSFSQKRINTFVIYNYCRLSLLKCILMASSCYRSGGALLQLGSGSSVLLRRPEPLSLYHQAFKSDADSCHMHCNNSRFRLPFRQWKGRYLHFKEIKHAMYLQWLLMAKARQETCTPILAKEFKCKCPTLSPAQKLAVQTRKEECFLCGCQPLVPSWRSAQPGPSGASWPWLLLRILDVNFGCPPQVVSA